jgi:hypothetical protein
MRRKIFVFGLVVLMLALSACKGKVTVDSNMTVRLNAITASDEVLVGTERAVIPPSGWVSIEDEVSLTVGSATTTFRCPRIEVPSTGITVTMVYSTGVLSGDAVVSGRSLSEACPAVASTPSPTAMPTLGPTPVTTALTATQMITIVYGSTTDVFDIAPDGQDIFNYQVPVGEQVQVMAERYPIYMHFDLKGIDSNGNIYHFGTRYPISNTLTFTMSHPSGTGYFNVHRDCPSTVTGCSP